MKTTFVPIAPPRRALAAGRTALTPEVLAATAARYSRNNEGLEAILQRLDPEDEDKSVEQIFRFIDYGHQSIGDNAPVAVFMDGITISLAFQLWNLCPTASGQESSTRYLKLDNFPEPEALGIPAEHRKAWGVLMREAFNTYSRMVELWTDLADRCPEVTRIPRALLEDSSDKARKQVERMQRNYAFDRARVFLPAAGLTNMVLIMPATGWVRLCSLLVSHPMPEAKLLGYSLHSELGLAVPNLIRHIRTRMAITRDLIADLDDACLEEADMKPFGRPQNRSYERATGASLEVFVPPGIQPATAFPRALLNHEDRYAPVGSALRRTLVRYRWDAVGLAEIRDLNRHRTGSRYAGPVPVGFHAALDQVPPGDGGKTREALFATLQDGQSRVGGASLWHARRAISERRIDAPYWHLLGSQFPFEHGTTADKYLYEAELRTGTGAHYRYAGHHRDMLRLWYERFPETRGLIQEGSAEPE